jgi:hypothetical protein
MVPAGLLITEENEAGELWINLDYAIPDYRDSKLGGFLYGHQSEIFDASRYDTVYCKASTTMHQRYLKRMGFENMEQNNYWLPLHSIIHRKEKDLMD